MSTVEINTPQTPELSSSDEPEEEILKNYSEFWLQAGQPKSLVASRIRVVKGIKSAAPGLENIKLRRRTTEEHAREFRLWTESVTELPTSPYLVALSAVCEEVSQVTELVEEIVDKSVNVVVPTHASIAARLKNPMQYADVHIGPPAPYTLKAEAVLTALLMYSVSIIPMPT